MDNLRLLAIDPGPTQSAYIVLSKMPRLKILEYGIKWNREIFEILSDFRGDYLHPDETLKYRVVIEDIESFGMPVGYHVFETVRWTGRFDREWYHFTNGFLVDYIKRSHIKQVLCGNARAKDSNIRQALLDIWGSPGTKAAPGLTYGIHKDVWSALAVATTFLRDLDPLVDEKIEKL